MPDQWIGKALGNRYQVDSLLGQGGMSAVYRGMDPNLQRQVAIKLIHPHLSTNPNFISRFKEEAAAVARLRHPNIVQVYDFNNDGDTYYMVMEYLIGETLQSHIRRLNSVNRNMPYEELTDLCRQICEAVYYAHTQGLIHRDIKPSNIMLDKDGRAILMDFGIVKIVGGDYHTATGATVGTAAYMSPEQIRNEEADERSDIYSLGVTLYEMISGKTPYRADSALTLMMLVLNEPLPDLRSIRKGVPDDLVAIVEKAMAKDRGSRYRSMEEMAAALRSAGSAIVGVAPAVTVVEDNQAAKTGELPGVEAASSEASQVTAESMGSEAAAMRVGELKDSRPEMPLKGGRLSDLPTVVDTAEDNVSRPGELASFQSRAVARLNRRWLLLPAVILALVVIVSLGFVYIKLRQAPALELSPVDSAGAVINDQTAQFVVNRGRWETGATIEDLASSPVSSLIATASNREVSSLAKYRYYGGIWQVEMGELQSYLLGHELVVYGVAFSPDGGQVATASEDGRAIIWGAADGQRIRTIDGDLGGLSAVAFSPNNLLLAAGSWNGEIGLWQSEDSQLLRKIEAHEDGVRDIEFTFDGDLLVSASEDQTVKLWQVSSGQLVNTFLGHSGSVNASDITTDGRWLASASSDQTVGIWDAAGAILERRLEGHSEPVYAVAFSPDGSIIASGSADGTLRLWRTADGALLNLLSGDYETITSVAFSPDGKLLISGEQSGTIRFWGLSQAVLPENQ